MTLGSFTPWNRQHRSERKCGGEKGKMISHSLKTPGSSKFLALGSVHVGNLADIYFA